MTTTPDQPGRPGSGSPDAGPPAPEAPDGPPGTIGPADPAGPSEPPHEARRISRRALLGMAGVGLAGAGLAGGFAAGSAAARTASTSAGPAEGDDAFAFTGEHQAGITTPVQDSLHFATWDVTTQDRDEVVALLRAWTLAASRMTQGLPAGEFGPMSGPYDAPPDDTGEAEDLPASGLTITFGFGPSFFTSADGSPRFGLDGRRPDLLADLPHFPGDMLEDARCGGDLAVQACANDPQVAVHAIRNLARIAFGTASVRWSQLGYGRTSSTTTAQPTPRNLFGFKDGTANITSEESAAIDEHVWVAPGDGADWLAGGSYLVARRIRMTIETWDRAPLREQETIVGRTKGSGAPLSGGEERTEPDFEAAGRGGAPLIDPASHVRLAHPTSNGGARMLRRGYNYTDGSDGLGRLDAGLFFLAYVRDPATQYVPLQNALAKHDLMSEYLRHTGSGIWAVPRGVPAGATLGGDQGAFVGQELFA